MRVGRVFEEDAMAAGASNIDAVDRRAVAVGYAEETAAGVARINTVDLHIRSVVVGDAEGCITAALVVEVASNIADGAVP